MPNEKETTATSRRLAGLSVTIGTGHEDTNNDGGLAETLRRVADRVEDGELCGNIYDPKGDNALGSYDLWYLDGRRASQVGNRPDVRNPRIDEDNDRLPIAEAALTQVQHIAHDGIVDVERSGGLERLPLLLGKMEKIQSIAEGGEPDPEFLALLDGQEEGDRPEPAYTVVGLYCEDGQRYGTTVYTHNGPEAAEKLAQEACREANDAEDGRDLIEIAAVIAGEVDLADVATHEIS